MISETLTHCEEKLFRTTACASAGKMVFIIAPIRKLRTFRNIDNQKALKQENQGTLVDIVSIILNLNPILVHRIDVY